MRVVGGKYRHRNLEFISNNLIRPTKDRVKEAFFSAINNELNDKTVLDLFAGSGALGIEALSRGAKFCYFVDSKEESITLIKKNVNNLKIENAEIIKKDYQDALEYFKNKNIKLDIVILDPPYVNKIYQDVLNYLINNKLMNENSIFILESDEILNIDIKSIKEKDYKYGKTFIKIIRV